MPFDACVWLIVVLLRSVMCMLLDAVVVAVAVVVLRMVFCSLGVFFDLARTTMAHLLLALLSHVAHDHGATVAVLDGWDCSS
jgi:hypothetical protein